MQLRLTSILASLMLVAGLGGASAADMAVKALPPPPVVDSWTGFYLGLNAGGIWGSNHLTATPADPGTTAFGAPASPPAPARAIMAATPAQAAKSAGNWVTTGR